MKALETVTAGFLPLTDCMILAVAVEKGFAERCGLDLRLSKQQSWASIRDHMAVGHYEVAQMLAPMPIAFNTGLVPFSVPVIVPMALGLGGNAITASQGLWQLLLAEGAGADGNPRANGEALKRVITNLDTDGGGKLKMGVVHHYSVHNLELRYWLAACGIDPERDVEILIVPPPLMPEALSSGHVDAFCVGEPWNSVAVTNANGHIITTKSAIWRSSPEKVLGVRQEWAEQNPDVLAELIRALQDAAMWCGVPENRHELARILSAPAYLGVSDEVILRAVSGDMQMGAVEQLSVDDFFVPFDRAANFPWQSHALWLYSQMVRWGQIDHSKENAEIARQSYRPEIFRKALENTGVAIPAANMKVEGALKRSTPVGSSGRLSLGPDGFFDDEIFDPDNLEAYLERYNN